jgi:hypothetical protein
MISDDDDIATLHELAAGNANRILTVVCAKALATTPPSERGAVSHALEFVCSQFADAISARFIDEA